MSTVAAYGSWKSSITPDLFGKGNCKNIAEIQAFGEGVFWVETSITSGKRELYFSDASTKNEPVRWADKQSVQNCVHEYGGGSFIPMANGSVVYSTIEGVFMQCSPKELPVQLADAQERMFRFADFSLSNTHVFCVNESHQKAGEDPENRIISISLETKEQKLVATGADFYAAPRISPDGKRIVWMQWNHINMPWDETSIYMAMVNEDGTVSDATEIRSGVGKNINYYCPSWSSDGRLFVVNDKTNFWNVYEIADDNTEKNIFPIDQEIGYPLWQFSDRRYAASPFGIVFEAGGRLMLRRGDSVRQLKTPGFNTFTHLSLTDVGMVYCIAAGPKFAPGLLSIALDQEGVDDELAVLRWSRNPEELAKYDISEPEVLEFQSDGVTISGYFYPPLNRNFSGPPGTSPPALILGHSGPTAPASASVDLKKQFFTSRGFAVFDVNYRGSTGFGTSFRNALKREWGVVDRDDVIEGVRMLIKRGLVDSEKIGIMGSSASGFLLLSAIIKCPDLFKAAVSVYGVADLIGLLADTHKFEKGYNEALLGKYPEEEHIYKERSPFNHLKELNSPVAFIHGKEDTVVPVSQSVAMYDVLKTKGVATALMLFENEGHGFRGPEAARKSTEAAYYFLCKTMGVEPSVESELEIVNL